MSGHTPGPWCLVETTDPNIISTWAVHIGECRLPVFPYRMIYSVDRTQAGYIKDPQYMADARLIAAAPDLLAALRFIMAFYEPGQSCLDTNAWKQAESNARAAIAKAEGATS